MKKIKFIWVSHSIHKNYSQIEREEFNTLEDIKIEITKLESNSKWLRERIAAKTATTESRRQLKWEEQRTLVLKEIVRTH